MSNAVANEAAGTAPAPAPAREARATVAPRVNVLENQEGYLLEAELPGVSREGLDITVEGSELTIVGRRADPEPNAVMWERESSRADYRRVFELDPAIDTARIDAKLDQGLLRVRLPKAERVKPRKIEVKD